MGKELSLGNEKWEETSPSLPVGAVAASGLPRDAAVACLFRSGYQASRVNSVPQEPDSLQCAGEMGPGSEESCHQPWPGNCSHPVNCAPEAS